MSRRPCLLNPLMGLLFSRASGVSALLLHSNCYQGNKPAAAQQNPIVFWASEPFGLEREITNMTSVAGAHVAQIQYEWASSQQLLKTSSLFHKQKERSIISWQRRTNHQKWKLLFHLKKK